MDDKLHGIPRVDLETRPRWKRDLAWWFGGKVLATARASAIWRKIAMPYEVPLIKATGGRARLSVGIPIAVLTRPVRAAARRARPRWRTSPTVTMWC